MNIFLQNIGLLIVLLVTVGFLLDVLIKKKRRRFVESTDAIRSLRHSMPIVGHIWQIWGRPENVMNKAMKIFETYGDDNFKAWVADRVYFFIMKPEDSAITLGSHVFAKKSQEYEIMQGSIMGQGIFSVTDVPEWRKNRKLITPTFHFQILKTFIKNFHLEAKILADNARREINVDGEVEMHRLIGLCTLDMITKNAMGVSVEAQSNSDHVFVQGMETVLQTWFNRITQPWLLNKIIFGLSSLKVEHDKAMYGVRRFAMGVILDKLEDRHAAASKTAKIQKSTGENDSPGVDEDAFCQSRNTKAFLDLLIDSAYDGVNTQQMGRLIVSLRQQRDAPQEQGFLSNLREMFGKKEKPLAKGKEVTEMDSNNNDGCKGESEKDAELERVTRQLMDEVVTIMVGGQETTACENSFALLMLALHQDVQAKAVAELKEIFGEDDRSPTYDDLQKMAYLECVIKETMRLYPALPVMARIAQQTTVLSDNSVLPEGCTVVYFTYAMHRDPRYFPEPDRFLPDRFLPENCAKRHPYCFIPFGAGARNCIGQKYAMLQMKTVLSTMLREFKIFPSKCVPNMDAIKLFITVTLRSQTGCWVKLEERESLIH